MNKVTKMQAAYITGFFDGEDCVHGYLRRSRCPMILITITQKRTDILRTLRNILGYGRIRAKSKTHALWFSGKSHVTNFINLILPYSLVKRRQLVGLKLVGLTGPSNRGIRLSVKEYQQRYQLYTKLKELKHAHLQ